MKNQRDKFTLPKGSTYLNAAYMSPLLKESERAGIAGLRRKRNPMTTTQEDFFTDAHRVRGLFARLVGAPDPLQIALVPSASYGLSTAAANINLNSKQNIVVAGDQFPSNVYPWKRLGERTGAKLRTVAAPDTQERRGEKWNERILSSIDAQTGLVAIAPVHWTDGTRFDLKAIRKRLDDVGGKLVVDGTQSVGAMPFDLATIRPDALVCAGYKWLMGPYATGFGYFGKAFANGIPLEENWISRKNSENFAGLVNYEDEYQPGALRFDVGERSNFISLPMQASALNQILKWEPQRIQEYCRDIAHDAIKLLVSRGFWVEDENWRGQHLFGIKLPEGVQTERVKELLVSKRIAVSYRGNFLRVSPHVYNTKQDLNRLAAALVSLVR